MRNIFFFLLATVCYAQPFTVGERQQAVFDLMFPGVKDITMYDLEFTDWPDGIGDPPTLAEIDAVVPSWRRWRARKDKREVLLAKYREILQLQALRAEDPDVVTAEDIQAERVKAVQMKSDLDALPEPAITPAPTPTPKPE